MTSLPKELASTPLDHAGAKLRLAGNPLSSAIVDVLKKSGVSGLFEVMRGDDYEKEIEGSLR